MTVYVDDDGKAYHIYSAEENLTLNIAELADDYLDYTGRYVRVAPGGQNEAPAIFKRDGVYWMITSGCTVGHRMKPACSRPLRCGAVGTVAFPFCRERCQEVFPYARHVYF